MTNEDTIRLASYEEWIEHEREHRESVEKRNPESIAPMLSVVEKKESTRRSLMERFPYSAVLEGYEPYHDFASRWLWANVSPCDGKCHDYYSEYPACPVVLATKTLRDYQYTTKDGRVVKGKAPEYHDPGEHSHEGNWAGMCLTKSGYDCFYIEYFFQSEQDRERFIAAVPSFRDGDNFKDEEGN